MAESRNIYVKIENRTSKTFVLSSTSTQSGKFRMDPPARIAPGAEVAFWAMGHRAAGPGPEGQLVYAAEDDPSDNCHIVWDIPYKTRSQHFFTAFRLNDASAGFAGLDPLCALDNIPNPDAFFSSANYDKDYDSRRITAHVYLGLPPLPKRHCSLLVLCAADVDVEEAREAAVELQVPFANAAFRNALVPLSVGSSTIRLDFGPSFSGKKDVFDYLQTDPTVRALRQSRSPNAVIYITSGLSGSGAAADIPISGLGPDRPFMTASDKAWRGDKSMDWLLAHEMGHLMGARHHDDTNTTFDANGSDFEYDGTMYRTIMSKDFEHELVPQFGANDILCKHPYDTDTPTFTGDAQHNAAKLLRTNYLHLGS